MIEKPHGQSGTQGICLRLCIVSSYGFALYGDGRGCFWQGSHLIG